MRSKKAIIGSLITSIFSTILIIIILFLFILASFFVKFMNNLTDDRAVVVGEEESGLSNLKEYMNENYKEILKFKIEKKLNELNQIKNE